MTRRTRLTAGIFALLAMTFSLAENVMASICAPMPEMMASTVVGDSEPMGDDCMLAFHGERDSDQDEDGRRHCPFSPGTAAQGCNVAASLPALSVHIDGSPLEATLTIPFDNTRHDVLLATALFHPPKA